MDINTAYQKAIKEGNLSELQEIISRLNSLSPADKKSHHPLYKKIENDLFERNISLPNYNLTNFEKSIVKPTPSSTKAISKSQQPNRIEDEDDFEKVFQSFYSNSDDILIHLKGHFLFVLDNESIKKTKIIILTYPNCGGHPLVQRLLEKNSALGVEKKSIDEFIEACRNEPSNTDNKYLCILVITANLGFEEIDKSYLKELFEHFKKSSLISLKESVKVQNRVLLKDIDEDFYFDVQQICGTIFNNTEMNFEEERIIKKFSSVNTAIIDYKILKSGFSGSKVIEVRPIKSLSGKTVRYVIKYSKKDGKQKIIQEHRAFEAFIDGLGLEKNYSASYKETDQYEAIRYTYASSDSRTDSYSFDYLISKLLNGNTIFPLSQVITELLTCEPIKIWENEVRSSHQVVEQLYQLYIDDEKIVAAICLIKNCSEEELLKSSFWNNYQLIKQINLAIKKKVCHGDLHTGNFFKDESNVYLIDFGYTGESHAILDHTTLEASLKFKHIPNYVRVEDLIQHEKKLFEHDNFSKENCQDYKRESVNEIFKLICLIRSDARRFLHDRNSTIEYYISLFMITLRQVKYSDLNQLYAYESAVCLAEYIVNELKLIPKRD